MVKLNPDLVLDIGANYGEFSVTIANKHKNILSFEPNTDVFECLKLSINELENSNIHLYNIALGDKDLSSTLFIPTSSGNASLDLSSVTIKEGVKEQRTEEKDILNYISSAKSFVAKIDTEGTEYKMLNRIKENEDLFEWYCILFECSSVRGGDPNKINAITNFLDGKQIKLINKATSKLGEGLFRYDKGDALSQPGGYSDIIALYSREGNISI
jgi:FkbM family methyltransferase